MIWLLNILPTAFVGLIIHLITLAGLTGLLASLFMSVIPFVGIQRNVLKIVSIVLLTIGVFYEGVLYNQEIWEEKVNKLQQQVELAEQFSKEKNKEVEIRYVEKVKRVKEIQYVIQEKIKEVEKVIDAQCTVAPEAISILNEAAKNPNK